MHSFTVNGRAVTVFPAASPGAPVIYLNTFGDEGARVLAAAQAAGCPDFTLVAISGLTWNRDMAPWDCPPAFRGSDPCAGGADDYLRLLTGEILPAAEQALSFPPCWRGIAGYSLGGLFALYALCRTDSFSRAASVSGSLWFPGIEEYLCTHPPLCRPERVYLSLGDRESHTRSALLQPVQQNTERVAAWYRAAGIETVFCLNPGGHHDHPAERTAAGICWLLNR